MTEVEHVTSGDGTRVPTISPREVAMEGVRWLSRDVHIDDRGFLVETMRDDDDTLDGARFAMSYTSLTLPGQMRDRDRWHVHHLQEDRFVVVAGEMVLVLYDPRPRSETRGMLAAIRMTGPTVAERKPHAQADRDVTYAVRVPQEVYHSIGNLHPVQPFLLENFPTRKYDPADEGRVNFADVQIPVLGGHPFSWSAVQVIRT